MKLRQTVHREGFTLMELIVAVGLMAIMFSSLTVVFKQVTDLIRRSEAEVEIYQTFRHVSRILKSDFESIVNYEDPVFYGRVDEQGRLDPKQDLCGYLRIEHHIQDDGTGPDSERAVDNISFLGTDAKMLEIENYLVPANSRWRNNRPYVKTNVYGSDLVEISYALEDKRGKIVGIDSNDKMIRTWKLVRYVRKVTPKDQVSSVERARGLYGLIYKGDASFTNLTGLGTDGLNIGIGIFNGLGKDDRVYINDYEGVERLNPYGRRRGQGSRLEKYGKREIIAEGCTEFDVKYWYYRKNAVDMDWRDSPWTAGQSSSGNIHNDGLSPGVSGRIYKEPFVLLGRFYNGCPPNPACMETSHGDDEEKEFKYNDEYAGNHPNWWYMPRMMQIRLRLNDRFGMIEQPFYTRFYLPSSDPYPRVESP